MRAAALAELVARDLRRSLRSFSLAALGITVGVATLAFFLALSEAMRTVVLGRIFPLDQVEVIPPESSVGSVFSMLGARPPGVEASQVAALRRTPGVRAVLPRMRFAFPTSGRGGRAVFGRDVGAGEIPADGVEPSLVLQDLPRGTDFSDPDARSSRRPCASTEQCGGGEFCVFPTIPRANEPAQPGTCQLPIPVVISPYLLEVFDGVIAPSHHLPRLGGVIARSAQGLTLEWDLGRAGLGAARQGTPRRVYAKLVGVSRHAMELGLTVPLDVARRLNREYAGEGSATVYSSVVVYLRDPSELTRVSGAVRAQALEIRTSGAEQMGLLVTAITVILALASGVTVLVASLNIAHAFLALIAERRGDVDEVLDTDPSQGEPGRLSALGRRDRETRALGGQGLEQLGDAVIPADEVGGVREVPSAVLGIEVVPVLGGSLQESREQRASDPGAGLLLGHLLSQHSAEGVLIGGDDERDGVGKGPVEIEEDRGPAGTGRPHSDTGTPRVSRRLRTSCSISSRTSRTTSRGWPCGSRTTQWWWALAGRSGSPSPISTTTSATWTGFSSMWPRRKGLCSVMPFSFMARSTSGLTKPRLWAPAARTWMCPWAR